MAGAAFFRRFGSRDIPRRANIMAIPHRLPGLCGVSLGRIRAFHTVRSCADLRAASDRRLTDEPAGVSVAGPPACPSRDVYQGDERHVELRLMPRSSRQAILGHRPATRVSAWAATGRPRHNQPIEAGKAPSPRGSRRIDLSGLAGLWLCLLSHAAGRFGPARALHRSLDPGSAPCIRGRARVGTLSGPGRGSVRQWRSHGDLSRRSVPRQQLQGRFQPGPGRS